jgi:hypothetical protein
MPHGTDADVLLVPNAASAPLLEPEDLCDPKRAAWYRLTPVERWVESERLWATYLTLGGTLDPEPDTQSPFHDADAWRTEPAHGRSGVHPVRRSGV